MAKQRCVDKLLAVFNLNTCQALGLPEGVSTQVMFLYDRATDAKEFSLLDSEMPKDTKSRIISWLHEHVGIDEVVGYLSAQQPRVDDAA